MTTKNQETTDQRCDSSVEYTGWFGWMVDNRERDVHYYSWAYGLGCGVAIGVGASILSHSWWLGPFTLMWLAAAKWFHSRISIKGNLTDVERMDVKWREIQTEDKNENET